MAAVRRDDATPPLTIQLFGPCEARVSGHPLPHLSLRKSQSVLALLTLRQGAEVEREWLAGLLWPESASSQALRNCLTDLRRALGSEAGRLRSPSHHTLSLDLSDAAVDVFAFDRAIARGDPASLAEAVALYRGPLLEGCAEEWAFQARRAREQAYLLALETLAERAMAREDLAASEDYLRRAVAVDPLRESAQRALMRALAAGGNYAAALLVYRELRLLLHRELNADPDPETEALFQQIRAEARQKAGDRGQGTGVSKGSDAGAVGLTAARTGPRPLTPVPSGTVTFLFTDIEGSTQMWEEAPDAMPAALARHDSLLRSAIETQGGHLFKTVGDALCAAFATAPEALAAALDAQRALQQETWEGAPPRSGGPGPLRVRMALHTGAAEEREGDYFGPALNRVARLLNAGHGGQVLCSQTTADLVRDALPGGLHLQNLGEHRLKGLTRPERIFQLLSPDLPTEFPPLQTREARPHNMPVQRTPPLGREKEAAAVRDLLLREEVSLVTLTGPGGTGKTRLSLEVARRLLDAFESGVYFVDLAPIRDPDLVAATIGQALGVQAVERRFGREADRGGGRPLLESLRDYLRERALLLLLDNFEQVLEAAPLVADLLAAAPRLKVLVTSRERLHLREEREFPVPPLALPDPKHLPPIPAFLQYGAVQLFVERAVAAKPEFAATEGNASAVAEICRRLDGLPLAIELGATWIKLFSPQAMLSRLESRLQLLTGGARDQPARQQTLRDTIAWSYDLLDENEKRLFRRLSIFVGGCTLEAVEAVCNAEGDLELDVLDGMASLVDKSLLRREEGVDGEPRFGMLETIREFGLECLSRSGEAESLRRWHLNFFMELAERAEPELRGPEQVRWLDRLEEEHDNVRAALEWSRSELGSRLGGLRLGGAVWLFWHHRGYWYEGRAQLAHLLAPEAAPRDQGEAARLAARAKVLIGARWMTPWEQEATRAFCAEALAIYQELGDRWGIAYSLFSLAAADLQNNAARALLDESLALFRELGDPWCMSLALRFLGEWSRDHHDVAAARAFLEEALATSRQAGNRVQISASLNGLGLLAQERGDFAAAQAFFEEALAVSREMGFKHGRGWSLANLGQVAFARGDSGTAREYFAETLAIAWEIGTTPLIAMGLDWLARIALTLGQAERAARLFGAEERLREVMGTPPQDLERAEPNRSTAAARAALGEEAFAAAWAAGRAMSSQQAVAYALEPTAEAG